MSLPFGHGARAALELAAERGWKYLSLADIGERAGLSLAEFRCGAFLLTETVSVVETK
jgi:hypothetical protein